MIEVKNIIIFIIGILVVYMMYNCFNSEQIFFQNVSESDVLPIDESKMIGIVFLDDETDVLKWSKQYIIELNQKINLPMCQIISEAKNKTMIYHRDDLRPCNFQKYIFGWDKMPMGKMMESFRIRPKLMSWIRPILNTKTYFIIGPISWFKKWKLDNLINLRIYMDYKSGSNIIYGIAQGTGAYIPTQTIYFSSRCIVE